MPTGEIQQDLPPPPTTQEKVHRSRYPNEFEHSCKVELNRLLHVRRFKIVDEKDIPKTMNVIGSQWVHTYKKANQHGNKLKTKSRVVAKGFTQVQYINDHEATPPHVQTSARENVSRDCEREMFACFPS